MKIMVRFIGALALIFPSQWPTMALAGHPLLTEDTNTQRAGRYQMEMTHDLSYKQDGDIKTRARDINSVLSVGLAGNFDVIASLPYERLTERAGTADTSVESYADMEVAAKWRFYEQGALSFALRPGIKLPTGNKDKDSNTGRIAPSLFLVSTYASDPWAFHLHVGYSRNFSFGAEQRDHIYHASVATEYRIGERLRLVSDASIENNAERSGRPGVGSVVIGFVYSITPNLDLDLGYRKGLTAPALDYAWLTGLALRF